MNLPTFNYNKVTKRFIKEKKFTYSMEKNKTQPYEGRVDAIERIIITPDISTIIYFASIGGRSPREQYEWAKSQLTMHETKEAIAKKFKRSLSLPHTAGYFVSFPHITKRLSWHIGSESNLYNPKTYNTKYLSNMTTPELGCLVELLIFTQEAKLWAKASTPKEYLEMPRSKEGLEITLEHPNKLLDSTSNP